MHGQQNIKILLSIRTNTKIYTKIFYNLYNFQHFKFYVRFNVNNMGSHNT